MTDNDDNSDNPDSPSESPDNREPTEEKAARRTEDGDPDTSTEPEEGDFSISSGSSGKSGIPERTREVIMDARNRLTNLSTNIEFGADPSTFDIPSKLPRRYLGYRRTPNLMEKTITEGTAKVYESILREWVNFLHHDDLTVENAQFEDFLVYIMYCIAIGRRTQTVMCRVSVIKGLYEYLKLHEADDIDPSLSPIMIAEIDRNAVDDHTPDDIQRGDLSRDKIVALFVAMESDRNRLMVLTGVETGFRNSEIREIRVIDVDFGVPEITTHAVKGGGQHTVPISEDIALEYKIWIENGRNALLAGSNSPFLFPKPSGEKIENSETLGKYIHDAAEDQGIQSVIGMTNFESPFLKEPKVVRTWHEVVPHALRHTFITMLEEEGVPLEYRRLLAGHSSAETTRGYSHGKDEVLKQAQKRVDLNYPIANDRFY